MVSSVRRCIALLDDRAVGAAGIEEVSQWRAFLELWIALQRPVRQYLSMLAQPRPWRARIQSMPELGPR